MSDVSDDRLAERLRLHAEVLESRGMGGDTAVLARRAADALDEAAAEVERLRAEVRRLTDLCDTYDQVWRGRVDAAEARLDAVRALCLPIAARDPQEPGYWGWANYVDAGDVLAALGDKGATP